MLKVLINIPRLIRIVRVFLKYDLGEFVPIKMIYGFARVIFVTRIIFPKAKDSPSKSYRLRKALEDLGPVFVKFGQMLSTRPDLISDDLATELTKLQDDVPPFSGKLAKDLIEQAYGKPLDKHFSVFESDPVASASVAQVHRARLHDGTVVIVKVLRPAVEEVINRDIQLLYFLACFAERYFSEARRLRAIELVNEYKKTINDELDLMREASNASKLRSNFADSEIIYVPKVYWEHTRSNVMVMEEVTGIPIRDIDAIQEAGVDLRRLAHNGVEIFFTQAFRDGFFHADMHPGNIFVGLDGQYKAVDFGIMGTLGDEDKLYLAENFLAFFNRDYRRVAEAHIRAGWVPPDTRVDEFEAAIRAVCEPIFAKPISEISFARLVVRLFQTARRFNMPIQPQLVLLQKTLFNIEGLGRQLYPGLDLWETAKPYLERWVKDQIGPAAILKDLRQELPRLAPMIPKLSTIGSELLRETKEARQASVSHREEVYSLRSEIRFRRLKLRIIMLGFVILLIGLMGLAIGGMEDVSQIPSWAFAVSLMLSGLAVMVLGVTRTYKQ